MKDFAKLQRFHRNLRQTVFHDRQSADMLAVKVEKSYD